MSKYMAVFEVPVTVCLNPEQLKIARTVLAYEDNSLYSALNAYDRMLKTCETKVRVGILPDGTLEAVVD